MREWCWWWLRHKKWKLEKRREEAFSDIRIERSALEAMAQRPRAAEDALDEQFLSARLERLSEIEKSAEQANNTGHLDDLISFAQKQGQLRAFLCPIAEIEVEATLVIDLLEEWGVPKTVTQKLFKLHVEPLRKDKMPPRDARGVLRSLFQERDSWSEYKDDYEDTLELYTWWLSPVAIILPFLSAIAFHYAFRFSPLLVLGLLFAGGSGSCVSVLAKMPLLDITLSAEFEAYGRRIFSRIAAGVGASLIGSAFLAWGLVPISFQNQTFADAVNASLAAPAAGIKTLILLGVPMLFGFSERALTSFEQRIFGNIKTVTKPD
jgi:hypothetical protein